MEIRFIQTDVQLQRSRAVSWIALSCKLKLASTDFSSGVPAPILEPPAHSGDERNQSCAQKQQGKWLRDWTKIAKIAVRCAGLGESANGNARTSDGSPHRDRKSVV